MGRSVLFKLVREWRYNYPTLKVLFESILAKIVSDWRPLVQQFSSLFVEVSEKTGHPMQSLDMPALV
jgi:hypothetical protein